MPSKSLKTTFKLPSASLDEAIVYLSERFLRAARGLRVVKSPNEFCLLTLCHPLTDRWLSNQLPYGPGHITLIFHSDALSAAADIVMYVPDKGDRLLYTRPHLEPPSGSSSGSLPSGSAAGSQSRALETAAAPVMDQEALVRSLSQAFQASSRPMLSAIAQLTSRIQQLEVMVESIAQRQAKQDNEPAKIDANQQINQQVEAIAQQVSSQRVYLEAQLEAIQAQISDLNLSDPLVDPPVPQTNAEWRSRIAQTRGTVGDYETYSTTYRERHADAPLFETPDWVMLCELDWAQQLCPDLAALRAILYDADGAGDEGADVLQQFGAHRRDGETYYFYQERGYQAEAAMQEIAHHPDYSWLPTLRQLWQRAKAVNPSIFALFGWEPAAVAALKAIAEPPRHQSRSAESAEPPWAKPNPKGRSLLDYQALLNIGPFAPLTAEAVKRAYRQAMKTAHPDSGGSTQKAQQLNEAYQAVIDHYFPSKI